MTEEKYLKGLNWLLNIGYPLWKAKETMEKQKRWNEAREKESLEVMLEVNHIVREWNKGKIDSIEANELLKRQFQ